MPKKPLVEKLHGLQYIKVPGNYPPELPTKAEFAQLTKLPPGAGVTADEQKLALIGDYLADLAAKTDTVDTCAVYGQIYFLTDCWLRNNQHDPRLERVRAVFLTIVDKMCREMECGINVLPKKIEEFWGRCPGDHGCEVDTPARDGAPPEVARYLERKKAEIHRLTFINGLAYRLKVEDGPPFVLARADSRSVGWTMSPDLLQQGLALFNDDGYAGFALSMGRDFYMTKHRSGFENEPNFFHSSYLAGNAVLCTGSMLIEDGAVKAVTNDSGHLRPRIEHLLNVVEALHMYGVDIAAVTVKALKGSYEEDKIAPLTRAVIRDRSPGAAILSDGRLEVQGDVLVACYGGAKGNRTRIAPGEQNVDHHARGLKCPNREPRIPTCGWTQYWQNAQKQFAARTKRQAPTPKGFPRGIEGALGRCDEASTAVIDRLYENRGAAQACEKFLDAIVNWGLVLADYIFVLDSEMQSERDLKRSKQPYSAGLAELKDVLVRINEGITTSAQDLKKKTHPAKGPR